MDWKKCQSFESLMYVSHCKPVNDRFKLVNALRRIVVEKKCQNEIVKDCEHLSADSKQKTMSEAQSSHTVSDTKVTHKQTHESHEYTFWPWFSAEVRAKKKKEKTFTLFTQQYSEKLTFSSLFNKPLAFLLRHKKASINQPLCGKIEQFPER